MERPQEGQGRRRSSRVRPPQGSGPACGLGMEIWVWGCGTRCVGSACPTGGGGAGALERVRRGPASLSVSRDGVLGWLENAIPVGGGETLDRKEPSWVPDGWAGSGTLSGKRGSPRARRREECPGPVGWRDRRAGDLHRRESARRVRVRGAGRQREEGGAPLVPGKEGGRRLLPRAL